MSEFCNLALAMKLSTGQLQRPSSKTSSGIAPSTSVNNGSYYYPRCTSELTFRVILLPYTQNMCKFVVCLTA